MIQSTSYTSILACRQEHTSHWPLTCIEECWRWSIAGGEYCDTAGTPVALEHGGSFVLEQHCTAVLEHSGTAALALCCTVVVVNQCTVAWVPASALAGTVVWEHWSTAPRAPAGSSVWAPGNTPALVLHCIVVLAHLHTVL